MGAKKTNPDDNSSEEKGKMKVVTDDDAKSEKKSLFGSAKTKPAAKSKKEDKEAVIVPDMEQKLKDLQEYRAQIADLEALVSGITGELKSVAWDKFIELYKRDKANPNTFYIKDGSGCIMVLPTDKYISIKDEERADKLEKEYGDIVSREEKFYFNSAVLERNMETIEKLLMESKDISDEDKENLLQKEVKLSIKKGTIDDLLKYGDKMATALSDIQPVMQLKNCGGEMAEGGVIEEGEIIYDSRDDYFRNDETSVVAVAEEEDENFGFEFYDGGNGVEYEIWKKDGELYRVPIERGEDDENGGGEPDIERDFANAELYMNNGGKVHDHRLNSFEALVKKYNK